MSRLDRDDPTRGADPVWAHRVFRRVLDALAHPGLATALPGCDLPGEAVWALLYSVWPETTPTAAVGAVPAPWDAGAAVEDAEVVVVAGPSSGGALARARRGTEEHPEEGATIVYLVDRLDPAGYTEATLSGPGIPGTTSVSLPISPAELAERARLCAEWPRGADVLIAGPDARIVALPRTTRVEVHDGREPAEPGPKGA